MFFVVGDLKNKMVAKAVLTASVFIWLIWAFQRDS